MDSSQSGKCAGAYPAAARPPAIEDATSFPTNQELSLESLPVEIILKILGVLERPADLAALINSSPRMFRIYLEYRSSILLQLLDRFTPDGIDFLRGASAAGVVLAGRTPNTGNSTNQPGKSNSRELTWRVVQSLFKKAMKVKTELEWWYPVPVNPIPTDYSHVDDLSDQAVRGIFDVMAAAYLRSYDRHIYALVRADQPALLRLLHIRGWGTRRRVDPEQEPQSPLRLTNYMPDYPFKVLAYYYHQRPQKCGDRDVARLPPSPSGAFGPDGIVPRPSWDMADLEDDFDEHLTAFWQAVELGRAFAIPKVRRSKSRKVNFTDPEKLRLWKALLFLEIMNKRCLKWAFPTYYWQDRRLAESANTLAQIQESISGLGQMS